MTIAEKISKAFEDDGQRWRDAQGVHINEACSAALGLRTYDTTSADVYRWDFRDGSCLTMCGDGWDLGFPRCYCWQEAGHVEDCPADDEAE